MPYVFKEVLEEGEEEAQVYSPEDYDAVITERDALVTERDGLITQRDTLIEQVSAAERERDEAKNKYADAFITSPARMKRDQEDDVQKDGRPSSYEELFAERGDNGAY